MKQPFAKGPSTNALSFGQTKGGKKIMFSENGHVSSSETSVGNNDVNSGGRGNHAGHKGHIGIGGGRGRSFTAHPHHSSHRKDYVGSDVRNKKPTSFVASKEGETTMVTEVREDGSEVPKKLNNKVFIDGLPYNFDPARHDGKTLDDLLSQYINDWKIGRMMHLTKKPGQGFGYVAFRSPNSAEVAVRVLNGRKFLGQPLRVELPKLGAGMRGRLGDDSEGGEGNSYNEKRNMIQATAHRQVLLSDLNKKSEPEVIREILRNVAPHMEQKIETIKMASNNRKAFLTLESPDDVEKVVKFLDGFQLLGRTIAAARAQPPGSLPYSKVAPVKPSANSVYSTTGGPVGFGGDAHDNVDNTNDDDEAIPLGAVAKPMKVDIKKPTAALTALGPKVTTAPAGVSAITPSGAMISNRVVTDNKGIKEVYVGNLSEDTTEAQLKAHFSQCGFIKDAKMITNPVSNTPTGIASIKFALASAASFALLNMNGSRLNGNTIRVDDGDVVSAEAPQKSKAAAASKKDDHEIDEEGFLRKRGIKNPKAYFDSVPKVESLEKAAEALAAKKEKAAAALELKKNNKRLREDEEAAQLKESEREPRKAARVAAGGGKVMSKSHKTSSERIEKPVKKAGIAMDKSNTVSFDEYGVAEAKVSASKHGHSGDDADDDDEEERFVDVDVQKEKGGSKDKKKKQRKN